MAGLLGAGAGRVDPGSSPVDNKRRMSDSGRATVRYRGRDRRARTAVAGVGSSRGRVLWSALAICAGTVPPVAFLLARGAGIAAVADFVTVFSGLVGVAAGIAALVSWRIVGIARLGWLGVALVDFGVFSLLQSSVSVFTPGARSGVPSLVGLVVASGAGLLFWKAIHSPEVDAGLSPLRSLCVIAGGTLVTVEALNLLAAHGLIPAAVSDGQGGEWAGLAAAAMWAGLAAVAWRDRQKTTAVTPWPMCVIGLLGLAAVAPAAVPARTATLLAGGLTFIALTVALGSMASELQEVLTLQNGHLFRMHLDLDDVRRQMVAEHEALEERLHDLRNTVGAIRTADRVLHTYARQLGARDQHVLTEALTAELNRLQSLVEPLQVTAPVDASLGEVLAPVIETERSYGTDITVDLGNVRARVNADALVQVVQNLLVNARHYAPDSPVWIEADERDGRVELRVIDRGPGVTRRESLAIFSRGARGASSAGTQGDGLGLFIAARLVTEMGGSIRLGRTTGPGACFVLELVAAGPSLEGTGLPEGAPAGARRSSIAGLTGWG